MSTVERAADTIKSKKGSRLTMPENLVSYAYKVTQTKSTKNAKNMITSLTEEQIAKFPEYVRKWVDIGISTEEVDMIECVSAIKNAYKKVNISAPEYFIGPVNNPYEGLLAELVIEQFIESKTKFKDSAHLNTLVMERIASMISDLKNGNASENLKSAISSRSLNNQIHGFQEYWLSYYDYFINECGLDLNLVEPLIRLSKVCGWWTPLANIAIIQHKPLEIHRDAQNRLHNTDGAAVKYRGDFSDVYAVNGVRVTEKIINRDFTHEDIENEENVEVRRVMIDLYGQAKFLIDSHATLVHKDDFGELYRKEIKGETEPMMMVKVVNSTQEPDGSYKDYFIRVDPNAYGGLKTAHAAVASTWRNKEDGSLLFKSPNEYNCDIQS